MIIYVRLCKFWFYTELPYWLTLPNYFKAFEEPSWGSSEFGKKTIGSQCGWCYPCSYPGFRDENNILSCLKSSLKSGQCSILCCSSRYFVVHRDTLLQRHITMGLCQVRHRYNWEATTGIVTGIDARLTVLWLQVLFQTIMLRLICMINYKLLFFNKS